MVQRHSAHALVAMVIFTALIQHHVPAQEVREATPGNANNARIIERDRLISKARQLEQEGKLDEAVAAGEELLSIQQTLHGENHASVAATLEWLGRVEAHREGFQVAESRWRQALQMRVLLHGEQNWRVADARAGLRHARLLATLNTKQRKQLRTARGIISSTDIAHDRQDIEQLIPSVVTAISIREEILGEEHRDCATGLNNLAGLYHRIDRPDEAEPLYGRALKIRRKVLGPLHPLYAQSLQNLADVYAVTNRGAKAIPLLERALDVYRQAVGQTDAAYLRSLRTLRAVYHDAGRTNKVEELYLREVQILKNSPGESHLQCAATISDLGLFYLLEDRYDNAEPLFREALDIRKQSLGEKHVLVADSLDKLAMLYSFKDEEPNAVPLFRQALKIRKQTQGGDHPQYLKTLDRLATTYEFLDQFAMAKPLYEELVETNKRIHGENHPEYIESLYKLGFASWSLNDFAQAEQLYQQVWQFQQRTLQPDDPRLVRILTALGSLYNAMGQHARALPLHMRLVDIQKTSVGVQHEDYAYSLNQLAANRRHLGDFLGAERNYRKALNIFEKTTGKESRDYLVCLNNLAELLQQLGDYAGAEAHLQHVLKIRAKTLGKNDLDYALSVNNLANVYAHQGDFARAEPLFRKALAIYNRRYGERHPDSAVCLHNLASLYANAADFTQAESLFQRVLKIRKDVLGEQHPDYAFSLNGLGMLYCARRDYERAIPLLGRASEVFKRSGDDHPLSALTLNNLAVAHTELGDFARATSIHEQVRLIRETKLGKDHPDYAITLNNLGYLHFLQGDYEAAQRLYDDALRINESKLGENHPFIAHMQNNLALVALVRGQPDQAMALVRQTVRKFHQHLENASAAQSRRQQLAMLRSLRANLDGYLSVALEAEQPGAAVYQPVLAWKGSVFSRERQMRLAVRKPALAELLTKLQAVNSRLATLAFSNPAPNQITAWRAQMGELSTEQEQLERDLANHSDEFRQTITAVTVEEIQSSLPDDALLVDFLEFGRLQSNPSKPGLQADRHLLAFVIPAQGPVEVLDVGPSQPLVESINTWRQSFGMSEGGAAAAENLRRLLLDPIQEHLRSKKILLISPDGELARCPWAALSGTTADSYLVEEMALGVVPVPQLLPRLMAERDEEQEFDDGQHAAPSLLLVGDIDYDTSPGLSAQDVIAPELEFRFSYLAGTKHEIAAIEEIFGRAYESSRATVLRERSASEPEFRGNAPQHRFVHLATHGFFAPGSLKSAFDVVSLNQRGFMPHTEFGAGPAPGNSLTGFHPGLLSGIALAGANQRAQPTAIGGLGDDGILSALEAAALNLQGTEFVVLSACETGLGQVAGGEGMLGLQRAFQTAGAPTTVTTLWKIDDAATQTLMTEFYRNLWEKKMSKLEALRQAQIAMLNRYNPKERKLRPRGFKPREHKEQQGNSPYYWAAFVLSGDWR